MPQAQGTRVGCKRTKPRSFEARPFSTRCARTRSWTPPARARQSLLRLTGGGVTRWVGVRVLLGGRELRSAGKVAARIEAARAAALPGGERARAIDLAVDDDLDAERAAAARQPLEIDARARPASPTGGDGSTNRSSGLAARAQELAHLRIFDPEKAHGGDELTAADHGARLHQRARDRIGQRGQRLERGLEHVGFEARRSARARWSAA